MIEYSKPKVQVKQRSMAASPKSDVMTLTTNRETGHKNQKVDEEGRERRRGGTKKAHDYAIVQFYAYGLSFHRILICGIFVVIENRAE
jgi:hypothetical protein